MEMESASAEAGQVFEATIQKLGSATEMDTHLIEAGKWSVTEMDTHYWGTLNGRPENINLEH